MGGREVGNGNEEAGLHGVCVVGIVKRIVLDSQSRSHARRTMKGERLAFIASQRNKS